MIIVSDQLYDFEESMDVYDSETSDDDEELLPPQPLPGQNLITDFFH